MKHEKKDVEIKGGGKKETKEEVTTTQPSFKKRCNSE